MTTPDFFHSRLDAMIDLTHPLAVLAARLPWGAIEAALAPKSTRQELPIKRVLGQDLLGSFVRVQGNVERWPRISGHGHKWTLCDINPGA